MCDKVFIENGAMLVYFIDCYKDQKMCIKAVDNYYFALRFVHDSFKTQNMCKKDVRTYLLSHNLFLNAISLKKCLIKLYLCISFYS